MEKKGEKEINRFDQKGRFSINMEEQNDLKKPLSTSFNTLHFHCLADT